MICVFKGVIFVWIVLNVYVLCINIKRKKKKGIVNVIRISFVSM